MRLIDADALDKETRVKNLSSTFPDWYDLSIAEKSALIKLNRIFTDIVREAPTIDAVPVVRCKDCKYWHESTGFCSKNSYFIDSNEISCSPLKSPNWTMWVENDFCSNGEMKDK